MFLLFYISIEYMLYDKVHFIQNDNFGQLGGPLQIFVGDSTMAHVVGIVSFGISCNTALPSIYTRVAYYLNWIESHVWSREK